MSKTGHPCRGDYLPLSVDKSASVKRLRSLVQLLNKSGKFDDYDAIIQEQLQEGISTLI